MATSYFVYPDSLLGIGVVSIWRGGREMAPDLSVPGGTDKAESNSGRPASGVKALGNHVKKAAVRKNCNCFSQEDGRREPWQLSWNPWRVVRREREGITKGRKGRRSLITALLIRIPAAYGPDQTGGLGCFVREEHCLWGKCSSRGRMATWGRTLQTRFLLHRVGGWNNNFKSKTPSNWKVWRCFLSYKTALLWPCSHEEFMAGKEQRSRCH